MEKHLAGCLDIFGILIDFRRGVLPKNHLVQTYDRVDRRPNFMTHVRKEPVLCLT